MTASGYPPVRREELAEQVHGRLIADPYRWLEDPDSEETRSWLAAQDALLAEYMATLGDRAGLAGCVRLAGHPGPCITARSKHHRP